MAVNVAVAGRRLVVVADRRGQRRDRRGQRRDRRGQRRRSTRAAPRSARAVPRGSTRAVPRPAWTSPPTDLDSPRGAAESLAGAGGPRPPSGRHGAASPAWAVSPAWLAAVAVLSGLFALGLEVLWTRMFAQVLQNSVYTFSTILVVFLAALADRLRRCATVSAASRTAPARVLWALLTLSGLGVAATPFAFQATDGRAQLAQPPVTPGSPTWSRSSPMRCCVLFVPAALLGSVFPYLLRASEGSPRGAGRRHRTSQRRSTRRAASSARSRPGSCCSGRSGLWNGIRS